MADLAYVVRYFRVVAPVPALLTASLAAATAAGVLTIVLEGPQDGAVAMPVIVLQAFSAATGFSAPARRGYFDLLLTRGQSRLRIALVQWGTAIAPGIVSCTVLAAASALFGRAAPNPLLSSGTLAAILMVSTIPWAVTVALPRFSGAIGWLLLVCTGAMTGIPWPSPVRELFFPLLVLGDRLMDRSGVATAMIGLSLTSLLLAMTWVHRTDIPLEASQ
jgi:hypothetical protein